MRGFSGALADLRTRAPIPKIHFVWDSVSLAGRLFSFAVLLFGTMFFAKYSPYFIVYILSITGVLSTPQIQGIAKSDVGLSQEGDLDDLPPSQAISLAFQQDPNSLSDHSLSEVAASLQLAKTFSPDSETFSILTPKLEFTPPIQNFALVALDENGGFTDVFPSFPSFPQLNILPQSGKSDPEIPSNTHTDSKTERKEPHCQHGKFAFCCQRGPPSRGANKVGISPDVLRERERERKSRLSKCKKCEFRLSTNAPFFCVISSRCLFLFVERL